MGRGVLQEPLHFGRSESTAILPPRSTGIDALDVLQRIFQSTALMHQPAVEHLQLREQVVERFRIQDATCTPLAERTRRNVGQNFPATTIEQLAERPAIEHARSGCPALSLQILKEGCQQARKRLSSGFPHRMRSEQACGFLLPLLGPF